MSFMSAVGPVLGAAAGGLIAGPVGAFIGAGVGSGVSSAISIDEANKTNKETAYAQMDYQERMSSTAHQREVADLKAAGLNPILSAKYGGSSTPSGSSYTAQSVASGQTDAVASTARSVLEMLMNKELIKTQQTQQDLNAAQTVRTMAEAEATRVNTESTRSIKQASGSGSGAENDFIGFVNRTVRAMKGGY